MLIEWAVQICQRKEKIPVLSPNLMQSLLDIDFNKKTEKLECSTAEEEAR